MTRYWIHTACPDAKRTAANALAGLSGRIDEHSIALVSTPGGGAAAWDTEQGYAGQWWGASQGLAPGIAGLMLYDGQAKTTESYYAAFDESSGVLLQHNCPTPPANATFEAFLTAAGLQRGTVESQPLSRPADGKLAFPK
jgi:hypothetical protein